MRFARSFAVISVVVLMSACPSEQRATETAVAESLVNLREKGSATWDMNLRFSRAAGETALGYELSWEGRGDFRRGVAESTVSVNVTGGNLAGKSSFDCNVVHQGESVFAQAEGSTDWVNIGTTVAGPDPMTLREEGNTLDTMIRRSNERLIRRDEIDGVPVRTFELTVDLQTYQKAFNISADELRGVEAPKLIASIDSDGLPRRFEIAWKSETLDGGWSLSFSDFGADVSVVIPKQAGPLTDAVGACFLAFPSS